MTIRLTHSAESELLRLVLEKIAAGESVAIGFHIAPARIARDRRVAPAESPPGMLRTEPPRQSIVSASKLTMSREHPDTVGGAAGNRLDRQ